MNTFAAPSVPADKKASNPNELLTRTATHGRPYRFVRRRTLKCSDRDELKLLRLSITGVVYQLTKELDQLLPIRKGNDSKHTVKKVRVKSV